MPGTFGGCLLTLFLFACCAGLFSQNADAPPRQQNAATVDPTSNQGSEEPLRYEIAKALGTSNRDAERVAYVTVDRGIVTVQFAINDNLTEGMIRKSAQFDIIDILKAVQESGYAYEELNIIGTFSLVDKFGNASEDTVLKAMYSSSTVHRINWDGFLSDNTYEVADSVWLHPTMR